MLPPQVPQPVTADLSLYNVSNVVFPVCIALPSREDLLFPFSKSFPL